MARRQYPFHLIEPKWQQHWESEQTFRAWNPGEVVPLVHPFSQRHSLSGMVADSKTLPPKCYILDMFPYPSGAGLHVGHPEGYTATDILSRYRRALGYNVLHPMGWDAFGLPAENYAVKTGQHPRITTEANIATFTRQIKSLGFSYDWNRELATTDPEYFRWTQWIFLQIYHSWFNPTTNKAEPINTLEYPAGCDTEELRRAHRDAHRLAFISEAPVNWCPDLGTVVANEEVVDGKTEVGGFPVIRKPMRQWKLRITAFADRLLADLDTIDWSDSLKEMQRNWIGRSEGAQVVFQAELERTSPGQVHHDIFNIPVFTTRPDTLFGATYLVLAPEHPFVDGLTSRDRRELVEAYRVEVARKSDLERTELTKEKTGVWTGAFAINPVTGEKIPIWIADYVLASYGTGAIMAVPGHDTRDLEFATKFSLPVVQVVQPPHEHTNWQGFVDEGTAVNSANPEFSLNGLATAEAKRKITSWLQSKDLGKGTTNYKLRDWLFARQRYWGEPFPIVWKQDTQGNLYHEALPESALPVLPPALEDYKPTPDGQPPLARAQEWVDLPDGSTRETNTMPQWAGSCWYYLRYLDPRNSAAFVSPTAESYWLNAPLEVGSRKSEIGTGEASATARDPESRFASNLGAPSLSTLNSQLSTVGPSPGVDLYVGGTEHAVLHLLYARFWHKVLFDLGHVSTSEPFFKLVNQGLILGEDNQKMSKSRGNVVNPDDILKDYGADAFRLYEMFLGPLQEVKPWNTHGVSGVYKFLGRVWRLFIDESTETEFEQHCTTDPAHAASHFTEIRLAPNVQDIPADPFQLKPLHACIKKVTEDLEALRFNTAISAMMIFVNEAIAWDVKPVSALKNFLQLLAPFAPHLAEELWSRLHAHAGQQVPSLSYAPWPRFDPALLIEDTLEIPVQVNGKLRDVIRVPATITQAELEAAALKAEKVQPFLAGKTVKKIILVPRKLVNIAAA